MVKGDRAWERKVNGDRRSSLRIKYWAQKVEGDEALIEAGLLGNVGSSR
jgi:hypothetical protein